LERQNMMDILFDSIRDKESGKMIGKAKYDGYFV